MAQFKWFTFHDMKTYGETIHVKFEVHTKEEAWEMLENTVKDPKEFFLAEINDIRECWIEYDEAIENQDR